MTTETMDCGTARVCLGVYVLGSIDPAERSLVDSHISACRDCRDELAGLAGIPALLARVSAPEAIALAEDVPAEGEPKLDGAPGPGEPPEPAPEPGPGTPPKELLGTVLDLTAARRRRRQWRAVGLSAAAAVIIAAGAFAGTEAMAGRGAGDPAPAAAGLDYGSPRSGWTTVRGNAEGMYGTVAYRQMGWGTQAGAKVVGVPVGTYCTLVEVGRNGSRRAIGGWTTDQAEGTIWYPASSGLPMAGVREFQITVAGHPPITIPA